MSIKSRATTRKTANPKLKSAAETEPKLFKDGLPIDAYAIREDEYDTSTWQLPHHTTSKTVDLEMLEHCTLLLSRWGDNGVRCIADPELKILAARHLAEHYKAAGKQPPVALCVLI